MTLNGSLAGLVAITAGCDQVSAVGAFLIGLIAGGVVVFGIEFIDRVLKIDDPVGAIGVHGICGALGTILVGIFSVSNGLFYGHGFKSLGVQFLGVTTVALWTSLTMLLAFWGIKKTIGLRVSEQEEREGLDLHEHGLSSSYADFMPLPEVPIGTLVTSSRKVEPESLIAEIKKKVSPSSSHKINKVEIYANPVMLDALKERLNGIGITGLTVTHVTGCGSQKGRTETYRGAPVEMTLLPKVKVETIVSKIPVKEVVDAAKSVLHTGKTGDGKIFVYDVENVIRISSGEEGFDALQYDFDKQAPSK